MCAWHSTCYRIYSDVSIFTAGGVYTANFGRKYCNLHFLVKFLHTNTSLKAYLYCLLNKTQCKSECLTTNYRSEAEFRLFCGMRDGRPFLPVCDFIARLEHVCMAMPPCHLSTISTRRMSTDGWMTMAQQTLKPVVPSLCKVAGSMSIIGSQSGVHGTCSPAPADSTIFVIALIKLCGM